MSEIKDRVIKNIADTLAVNEEEIQLTSHIVEDLGADSLDQVELVMALEDEFELEVPDHEAERLLTVQQMVDYVQARTGGKIPA